LDKTAWELILPDGMLQYFDVVSVETSKDGYTIDLVEKPLMPEEFKGRHLESHGFYEPVVVRDFPLRGKACLLQVKRRRWLDKDSSKTVSRDWQLLANGTRLTKEFADFLKALY